MNAIQFEDYVRFCAFCAFVSLMFLGVMLVAVFAYWLTRNLLAEVAGMLYPKLTREDMADWRQNNEVEDYDIVDGF